MPRPKRFVASPSRSSELALFGAELRNRGRCAFIWCVDTTDRAQPIFDSGGFTNRAHCPTPCTSAYRFFGLIKAGKFVENFNTKGGIIGHVASRRFALRLKARFAAKIV
jgi:hypothetical protein